MESVLLQRVEKSAKVFNNIPYSTNGQTAGQQLQVQLLYPFETIDYHNMSPKVTIQGGILLKESEVSKNTVDVWYHLTAKDKINIVTENYYFVSKTTNQMMAIKKA